MVILVEFWDVDIATAMARNLVVDAKFCSLFYTTFFDGPILENRVKKVMIFLISKQDSRVLGGVFL